MKTCQPAATRSRALATAVSARSRTAVAASSSLVPRTINVMAGGPFNRPRSAKSVPAVASSGRIAGYEPQVEPLGLLRHCNPPVGLSAVVALAGCSARKTDGRADRRRWLYDQ